ncbi:uncharacterized protein LOC129003480 [Macrosteles quadrilineatus]|uniref:uncharacterized protein LOC129003480 n=1 Tax=Macrosteles quadrilineatus TaxID=74068 RepID=UPI0023E11A6C|nr:uncharacterized protein LOC129003480 [Macrosteles quadrilineatus]
METIISKLTNSYCKLKTALDDKQKTIRKIVFVNLIALVVSIVVGWWLQLEDKRKVEEGATISDKPGEDSPTLQMDMNNPTTYEVKPIARWNFNEDLAQGEFPDAGLKFQSDNTSFLKNKDYLAKEEFPEGHQIDCGSSLNNKDQAQGEYHERSNHQNGCGSVLNNKDMDLAGIHRNHAKSEQPKSASEGSQIEIEDPVLNRMNYRDKDEPSMNKVINHLHEPQEILNKGLKIENVRHDIKNENPTEENIPRSRNFESLITSGVLSQECLEKLKDCGLKDANFQPADSSASPESNPFTVTLNFNEDLLKGGIPGANYSIVDNKIKFQ